MAAVFFFLTIFISYFIFQAFYMNFLCACVRASARRSEQNFCVEIQFYDFVYWFNNVLFEYWISIPNIDFIEWAPTQLNHSPRDRHNVAIFTSPIRPHVIRLLFFFIPASLEGHKEHGKKAWAWGKCWPPAKYTPIHSKRHLHCQTIQQPTHLHWALETLFHSRETGYDKSRVVVVIHTIAMKQENSFTDERV